MNSPSPLQGLEPSTNCIVMPKQNRNQTRSSSLKVKRAAPVAESFVVPKPEFRVSMPRQGGCAAYRGTDFIGTLASTTSAQAIEWDSIHLDSLQNSIFPRLAAIARVFKEYHFHKLKFHLCGRSASTQKGNLGFVTLVQQNVETNTDVTELSIKNSENCLVVRGWESGSHVSITSGQPLKWQSVDASDAQGGEFQYGIILISIPATAAAGDLAWDLYAEYDVEFNIAVGATLNGTPPPLRQRSTKPAPTKSDLPPTEETIALLRQRLSQLEKP